MSEQYYPAVRAILGVVLDGYAGPERDSHELVVPVLPRSCTVHRNTYKQADSWELTFDFDDLPFDPALIRSGWAEIYLYDTPGIGPDTQVASRQFTDSDPTDEPVDPVAKEVRDRVRNKRFRMWRQDPHIVGQFDEPELSLGDDGKWVRITGQDYTAHLAACQWPPTPGGLPQRIPVGRRLDVILTEILRKADPDERMAVRVDGILVDELPIVGAKDIAAEGRGIPVEQSTTVWDVMYGLAKRYGFLLYVDVLDVVLRASQSMEERIKYSTSLMRWGENIESMRMSRRLGKESVPTIICVGWDRTARKRMYVEYPPGTRHDIHKPPKLKGDVGRSSFTEKHKAPRPGAPKPTGKRPTAITQRDEYMFVVMDADDCDPVAMLRRAKTEFFLRGRAERRLVLRTSDLRDSNGQTLLNLRAGDGLVVEWDDFNKAILANDDVSPAAKVEHLLSKGFNPEVARTIATHYVLLAGLQRPLYVREVTYEFDTTAPSFSIELELIDFIGDDDARAAEQQETRADKREERMRKADGSRTGIGKSKAEERTVTRQGSR